MTKETRSFVQGLTTGLLVLGFFQLWALHRSYQDVRAAVFDLRNEIALS